MNLIIEKQTTHNWETSYEVDNIRYIVIKEPEKRKIKTFDSISKAIEFIDNYNIN
ncbi:hypothetical protein M0R04_14440 [Candidatus Dojkabacteria bacterium]|jgi:hypothetical protein|nr:hypothetical protein [Candidatus Dojkabacteria bacterium]